MTKIDVIKRWKESGRKNFDVARDMMKLGHYDWALFMGQLALEKLLKGLVVKRTGKLPPPVHNLVQLAKAARLSFDTNKTANLTTITRFHIVARYDDVKYEFYKEATESYAEKWVKIIEEYFVWIQKLY
ncbi:hypothetical protein A3A79_03150 [Candidatus Gottesmanbacteria bacterium RIFCSPLOWO2_01_FULL_43_11b]|uniref:HEPN domain-containing protein n=1 Tax=Candidatus Gottesmanbacteria bacterium RIFCSPLOWO2_01_FULL_43_11b TaxID=1798392 RepID=A0A1F6AIC7_9BACT|nr:MAG: hypothetical protein A3A79_03150 [Candidatus Gottesmanbacteria bacterium RIFCSPLOWO2_01_FULL_43_11b]